jgi:hypothetical protein
MSLWKFTHRFQLVSCYDGGTIAAVAGTVGSIS